MSEMCKEYFKSVCKTYGITQKAAIKAVWGKAYGNEYWVGNESKTVSGDCIWCARSIAVQNGMV